MYTNVLLICLVTSVGSDLTDFVELVEDIPLVGLKARTPYIFTYTIGPEFAYVLDKQCDKVKIPKKKISDFYSIQMV